MKVKKQIKIVASINLTKEEVEKLRIEFDTYFSDNYNLPLTRELIDNIVNDYLPK